MFFYCCDRMIIYYELLRRNFKIIMNGIFFICINIREIYNMGKILLMGNNVIENDIMK